MDKRHHPACDAAVIGHDGPCEALTVGGKVTFVEPIPAPHEDAVEKLAMNWALNWATPLHTARGMAREAYRAGFEAGARSKPDLNNDWFCSTECMAYAREDIKTGFCTYCAAPVTARAQGKEGA